MTKGEDEEETPLTPLVSKKVKSYSTENDDKDVTSRLASRRNLTDRKRWLNDIVTVVALTGLVLIILATELSMHKVFPRSSGIYLMFLGVITVSTIVLEVLLLWYHYTDFCLHMTVQHIKHWQLAVDFNWVLQVIVEVVVCLIHPFIGLQKVMFEVPMYEVAGNQAVQPHVRALGDIFTMGMFLRLYLVFRLIVLHSEYGRDLAVQVLTAYNNIKINFWFVLKSVLNSEPVICISAIVISGILVASWFMRISEANTPEHLGDFTFSNCLWLICITFLTVGYGDMTPSTTTGRVIAIVIALFGVGCTALLIGVVSNKLELSRNEKFLHNFVTDTSLRRELKSMASNIIKHKWMSFRYERAGKRRKAFAHGRRLLQAKQKWRALQRRLTDINDDTASIEAIYKEQISNSIQILELRKSREQEAATLAKLKVNMAQVKETLENVQSTLDMLTRSVE